jgi:hypothetical protein
MKTLHRRGIICAVIGAVFFADRFVLAQQTSVGNGSISVQLRTMAVGLNAPLYGTTAGDSRLFVANRSGSVTAIAGPGQTSTFFDFNAALPGVLDAGTSVGSENGFLGLAFHPNFFASDPLTPGYRKFYTYEQENPSSTPTFAHNIETFTPDNHSVIREWTANAAATARDPAVISREIMRIADPQSNHNGGTIAFGPDGYLYFGIGDGGGGNDDNGSPTSNTDGHTNPGTPGGSAAHGNAQDRRNVFGKILRIKPTTDADTNTTLSANGKYRIPNVASDPNRNPFTTPATDPNGTYLDEIYAYGLRNPYRFSFDKSNPADPAKRLIVTDVGQGSREEVDYIVNGGNYGWVVKEGTATTSFNYSVPETLLPPIAEYTHAVGLAGVGGFIYRGTAIPALVGKYVFGDYQAIGTGNGRLFYMDTTASTNTILGLTFTGSVPLPSSPLYGFGQDVNGELYAMFANGTVVQLVPEPATWTLAAFGATGVAVFIRRSRRNNRPARG